jgi:O-antigen/teichoic acid export membrane protein
MNSLRIKAFSAIRWVTISMAVKGGLYFFQLAILARFLNPSDFGLLAIVMAIFTFLQAFSDFGISSAVMHHQVISRNDLSSLFWVNFLGSIITALLIIVISNTISYYYDSPVLQSLLILSSLILIINSLGQQLRVLAEKNLDFNFISKIEVISSISGFIATIFLAIINFGVYSIILGGIISASTLTSLLWLFSPREFRPTLFISIKSVAPYIKWGSYVILNNLTNLLNYQADIFIGGKFLNADLLGKYSLAKELTIGVSRLINPIVMRIGMPAMSKVQDDIDKLKLIYLKALKMTASINFPIHLGMCFFSKNIIEIFFGSQWITVTPILQLLSIWGLLRSTSNPVGCLLIAKGRVDLSFKWNLSLFLVIIPLILLGSQYGLMGLTITSLIIMVLTLVPTWYFLVMPLCGASLKEYLMQFIPPMLISLVVLTASIVISALISNNLIALIFGITSATALYVLFSFYFNKEWFYDMKFLILKK